MQFGGLGRFSKKSRLAFNIIWILVLYHLEGKKWLSFSTKE